ncbi:MG2 domain-containing protein [Planctomycetota bacterium]
MNPCDQYQSQLDEYITGELNAEAAAEMKSHLQQCDSCRAEYETLHNVDEFLRRKLPGLSIPQPGTPFEQALQVAKDSEKSDHPKIRPGLAIMIMAAAVILLFVRLAPWRSQVDRGEHKPPVVNNPKPMPKKPVFLAVKRQGSKLQCFLKLHDWRLVAPENPVIVSLNKRGGGPLGRKVMHDKAAFKDGVARFEFTDPLVESALHLVKLDVKYGQYHEQANANDLQIVPRLYIFSNDQFQSGRAVTLNLEVKGECYPNPNIPLTGAVLAIELRGKEMAGIELFRGKTDPDGGIVAKFNMPDLAPEFYSMVIRAETFLGAAEVEESIFLQPARSDSRILINTDKSWYQPGQTMHLRGLALDPLTRKPAAGAKLTFEVIDSNGNKVFKKDKPANEFGVAAADFELADEINMGEYKVLARVKDSKTEARQPVTVQHYTVPKFAVSVQTDKPYYLHNDTVHCVIQADYFFGKPVPDGSVEISLASMHSEDEEWEDLESIASGSLNTQGRYEYEFNISDWVNLKNKHDANFHLEIKIQATVRDAAGICQSATGYFQAFFEPFHVFVIPESHTIVPGVENTFYVLTSYPDGQPASCAVEVATDPVFDVETDEDGNIEEILKDKIVDFKKNITLKTNACGVGTFKFTPTSPMLAEGYYDLSEYFMESWYTEYSDREEGEEGIYSWDEIRLLSFLPMQLKVTDQNGITITRDRYPHCDTRSAKVLLQLDRAIYQPGQKVQVQLTCNESIPFLYLDVFKSRRKIYSQKIILKQGRAGLDWEIPQDTVGTLEMHASRIGPKGLMVGDSQIFCVPENTTLNIAVQTGGDYAPGGETSLEFQVENAKGQGVQACLGVAIVDEAVLALDGGAAPVEKLFINLEEELRQMQFYGKELPGSMAELIGENELKTSHQDIARALLSSRQPLMEYDWMHNPAKEIKYRDNILIEVLEELQPYCLDKLKDPAGYRDLFWGDEIKSFEKLINKKEICIYVDEQGWVYKSLIEAWGRPLDMNELVVMDPIFSPIAVAMIIYLDWNADGDCDYLLEDIADYLADIVNLADKDPWYRDLNNKLLCNGHLISPDTLLADLVAAADLLPGQIIDPWGYDYVLVPSDNPPEAFRNAIIPDLHNLTVMSKGPDGELGSADDCDVRTLDNSWAEKSNAAQLLCADLGPFYVRNLDYGNYEGGGGAFSISFDCDDGGSLAMPGEAGPGMARVRSYFPETMLWRPMLITDKNGKATLPLTIADNITTWRVSAQGSDKNGLLGSASAPLKVFQDFFADMDLPVALTLNDTVSIPVTIYNYLKTPQDVLLELKPEGEPWFELIRGNSEISLRMAPEEVKHVYFPIRVTELGLRSLSLHARGGKMSDAVKRSILVLPDGKKIDDTINGNLNGDISVEVTVPPECVPGSEKLYLKIYPGICPQLVEGLEGMFEMPHG